MALSPDSSRGIFGGTNRKNYERKDALPKRPELSIGVKFIVTFKYQNGPKLALKMALVERACGDE
jgi:hypothetical protein